MSTIAHRNNDRMAEGASFERIFLSDTNDRQKQLFSTHHKIYKKKKKKVKKGSQAFWVDKVFMAEKQNEANEI